MQYPVAVMAFEKLLLACCLPVAGIVQTWGIIAAVGIMEAPYYAAAILCMQYYLFCLPLPSSFLAKDQKTSLGTSQDTDVPLIQLAVSP